MEKLRHLDSPADAALIPAPAVAVAITPALAPVSGVSTSSVAVEGSKGIDNSVKITPVSISHTQCVWRGKSNILFSGRGSSPNMTSGKNNAVAHAVADPDRSGIT